MLHVFFWAFTLTPVFMIPIYIEVKDNIPQLIALILWGLGFSFGGIFFGNLFGSFDCIASIFSKPYKEIYCRKEKIIIEEEKRRFLSSEKVKREILLDNIMKVSREEYQGNLNSITIFLKDNKEEFFAAQECLDLEGLYKFIIKQRELGKEIKINKIDIETCEETQV